MITLHAGDDLQHALDTAQPGETIQLDREAIWVGNFTLPVKPPGPPIEVRGTGPVDGPAPRLAEDLAALLSPNSLSALSTIGNTSGWRFSAVCFVAGTSTGDLVRLGDGLISDPSQLPSDIVFDRCLFRAAETAKNGLQMNAVNVTLRRCGVKGVKLKGQESHAIVTWNSPGPFLIEDCYLEAGSCGLLVGGAKAAIPNCVPSDLTFRRNTVTRPLELRGGGWGVKNLFELKNAKRVVCAGNVFEHNWPDSQSGWSIVFTVRANSPSAPWTTIQDVLFESNIVRHASMGFNLLGLDDQKDAAGIVYPTIPMDGVVIRNNLCYDIDQANWGGNGCFMNLGAAPRNLVVERNTVIQSGSIVSVNGPPLEGFRFVDNIALHNTYGIKGDSMPSGTATIMRYFPSSVVNENVLAGGSVGLYPAGNHFPSVANLMASFQDPDGGDFRTGMSYPNIGCDQDALDAASRVPEPPTLAETITALAAVQLSRTGLVGGDVSPQDAAQGAITTYRDALLAALETA